MKNEVNEDSKNRKRKYRPDRLEFLDQLVVEFQTTKSKDARQQVLANLANFAYDPVNYGYFRQLNILDLFLDTLTSQEENLIKFSIGGLCNLCLDSENKYYICKNGLKKIIKLLEHQNTDIKASSITTLMFLITPESKEEIINAPIIKSMIEIRRTGNSRLGNLASIFLEDYCTEEQIKEVSSAINHTSSREQRETSDYEPTSPRIGDAVSVKRKITAEDVKAFAAITKDSNPIHSDPEKGIVHGAFLNALVAGVIGTSLPGAGTVVVHQDLRFPKPCHVGSEVTIDVKVTSVRKLIEVKFEVRKNGEARERVVVLEGNAKLLIPLSEDLVKFENSYGHDYIKS